MNNRKCDPTMIQNSKTEKRNRKILQISLKKQKIIVSDAFLGVLCFPIMRDYAVHDPSLNENTFWSSLVSGKSSTRQRQNITLDEKVPQACKVQNLWHLAWFSGIFAPWWPTRSNSASISDWEIVLAKATVCGNTFQQPLEVGSGNQTKKNIANIPPEPWQAPKISRQPVTILLKCLPSPQGWIGGRGHPPP